MRKLLTLTALLMACLLLPGMALAQTQEEWNLSCMLKTSCSTTVYATGTREFKETIPANTYVKIQDTLTDGLCVIRYMLNGQTSSGVVARSSLVFCTSTVRGNGGYATTVHELDPDHDEILANTPVINVAESLLLQGDKDYSNLTFENPESSDAESAQQTAGRGEKVEAEKPTASTAPVQSASKNSGKTSASTKKNSAEKQEEAEDAAEASVQIGLVQLGAYTSIIEYEGCELTVPTAELQFSADVPEDKQVAYIHAPRTGRCYLRAKASDKGAVLDKCKAGTVVQVVNYGKSYCRIVYEGQVGYVQTACLKFLDTAAEPMCTWQLSYNGKMTGNAEVPIRNDESNDSAIIVKLRSGTEVTVFGKSGAWYEVEHNGLHGFVHKNFLRMDE